MSDSAIEKRGVLARLSSLHWGIPMSVVLMNALVGERPPGPTASSRVIAEYMRRTAQS